WEWKFEWVNVVSWEVRSKRVRMFPSNCVFCIDIDGKASFSRNFIFCNHKIGIFVRRITEIKEAFRPPNNRRSTTPKRKITGNVRSWLCNFFVCMTATKAPDTPTRERILNLVAL
ncbi:unnamed protein product, partial [Pylaiella littoralis]